MSRAGLVTLLLFFSLFGFFASTAPILIRRELSRFPNVPPAPPSTANRIIIKELLLRDDFSPPIDWFRLSQPDLLNQVETVGHDTLILETVDLFPRKGTGGSHGAKGSDHHPHDEETPLLEKHTDAASHPEHHHKKSIRQKVHDNLKKIGHAFKKVVEKIAKVVTKIGAIVTTAISNVVPALRGPAAAMNKASDAIHVNVGKFSKVTDKMMKAANPVGTAIKASADASKKSAKRKAEKRKAQHAHDKQAHDHM